jgi:Acyl-CoA reductase (LuxC)
MNLQERIELMIQLVGYLKAGDESWEKAKLQAFQRNPWFTFEFIDKSVDNIVTHFLQRDLLMLWAAHYHLDDNIQQKNVGIVMAGNIPVVGFHDFLAVFISGHKQTIKLSSKDDVLMKHIVDRLYKMDPAVQEKVTIAEMLKGCDAYIATGSNNSARYFEEYFAKYPNIIRRNKTSIAVLTGDETATDLENLSDDIHSYFGLGCRNITKLFVPVDYDFIPLLRSFDKYNHFPDGQKYKNNYDYQLSILLMNKMYYMTNGSTLLTENKSVFSPISVVHFEYYDSLESVTQKTAADEDIQCITGKGAIPFGQAQSPGLFSYADGIDTMQFLLSL